MLENGYPSRVASLEMVRVHATKLEGLPLDLAVAAVTGKLKNLTQSADWLEKCIEQKGIVLNKGGVYSPSSDLALASEIMVSHGIAVRKHQSSGKWFAMYSEFLGDGELARWSLERIGERTGPLSYQFAKIQVRFSHAKFEVAVCQCFVARKAGLEMDIPRSLFDSKVVSSLTKVS